MTHFLKKAALLVLIIVLIPLWSCLAEDDVFLRIDRDDPDAWKQELANVRFLTDENMSGSGSLVDRAAPEKSHVQRERCVLVRAIWLYIQENHETGYAMKWSEWLEAHSRTVSMQIGEKLKGEGFSSDPLVVADSLEALAAGTATVLSDNTVLNITVQ